MRIGSVRRREASATPLRVALAIGGLVLAVLAAPLGCSDPAPGVERRTATALEVLPFESLQDWRSYADLVAIVEVASERSAPDPAAKDAPVADPLRYVDLSVEHVLWARQPKSPDRLEILTWGWVREGKDLIELAPATGPRLEVGRRYVIGLVLGGEPGAMTASSVLPLDGDRIDLPEQDQTFPADLDGLEADELEARLLATKPDPLAVEHEDLPPEARAAAVAEAREG